MCSLAVDKKLATLLVELDNLSVRLVEREIQLAALQQDIHRFDVEYQSRIGPYYLRLDELNAILWERRVAKNRLDDDLRVTAESARKQAEATRSEVGVAKSKGVPTRVELPDDLRKLFRKAAMRLHPDRAENEAERQRREHWMVRLNTAYTNGDGTEIEAILKDFEESPEAVTGKDLNAKLERVRRQIETVKRHIARIESELVALEASQSNHLRLEFERQAAQGLAPYTTLISNIEARITKVSESIKEVEKGNGGKSNRIKFICPHCGAKAFGKVTLKLICGVCLVKMVTCSDLQSAE